MLEGNCVGERQELTPQETSTSLGPQMPSGFCSHRYAQRQPAHSVYSCKALTSGDSVYPPMLTPVTPCTGNEGCAYPDFTDKGPET